MFKKELRIVVTEDCNYNCVFCHREGMKEYENSLLTKDDIGFLYKTCKDAFDWKEVTITGGEPFMRKDIDLIIKELYDLGAKITVVTNGELLNRHIEFLKYIDRINLSIHTLDKMMYADIVQRDSKLEEVLQNISIIKNLYPAINIRLNSVIVKNQNDRIEDIIEYINFAQRINASIKFVELYSNDNEKIVKIEEISEILRKIGFKYKDNCFVNKQELTNGEITIVLSRIFCANAGIQIDPEEYCNKYNDIFITPSGKMNICRNSKEDISIYNELKNRNKDELINKIKNALSNMGKNCVLCNEEKKLAINGGIPVFDNPKDARFIHPKITPQIEKAVLNQLHTDISIYDNSGIFKEFEDNFSNYHNVKYGLTFSSGTAALWGMYEGIGLQEGDEIICPCYTFFATVTPILFTGATPVFVDCLENGNIDVNLIEEKINNKTKAIVVTHMWGYPCEMDKLRKIADKYNLFLLEDCSHAHGAEYKNKKVGSWGDAAAFSLQGQKIITGGEGGILITNNKEIKERALLLGHYNKRCKKEISQNSVLYKYAITGKGMKLRAHPLAICIANEYFKNLELINSKKNEYAKIFYKELKDIKGLTVLPQERDCKNSWYAIILKYNKEYMSGVSRERFVEALHAEGAIEVDIPNSTAPLNNLELFKDTSILFNNSNIKIDCDFNKFKSAKEFYDRIIKLPVWYREDEEDVVLKYIKAIKKVCNNIKELI